MLSHDWYVLRATTADRRGSDGTWRTGRRETCDRGDGAPNGADRRLGIEEARAAVGTEIVDAKTIMLVQWALRDGPFA